MTFCGLMALAFGIWIIYLKFVPNFSYFDIDYGAEHPIVFNGELMKEGAVLENGEPKLPLSVAQLAAGSKESIRYEEQSGSIIMTTSDKVLRMKTKALTAALNEKPLELRFAAEARDGTVYLPIEPLEQLYGLYAEVAESTGIVTVLAAGQAVQLAEAVEEAKMRSEPTIRAPIVEALPANAVFRVWGEKDGWYRLQSPGGYIGYISKRDVKLREAEKIPEPERSEPFVAWNKPGQKINMTWEAVYNHNPDPSKIGPLPGVNVVSPTWFELLDGDGKIRSKADAAYVRWAHRNNKQVWGLFSNGFEPERTTEALADADTRFSMIKQLLAYAKMFNLQGINIDFENVYTKDKENLVQFVRELTPLLHEQNLAVSIDVTPKSNSEMWSAFLDRRELGRIVDYMIVMAYDEHWASSPKAGSVASLPWTEASVKRIIEEDGVPPEKLILGMPLYTRIWTEKQGESGVEVSSKAVGMDQVADIIAQRKLKPEFDESAGQHYVEYEENGALQRIWIEDERSAASRVGLVRKYDLAGVATWQRSFGSAEIWPAIDRFLKQKS